MTTERERVYEIVAKYESRHDSLIPMLQEIQSAYNYLPEGALRVLAEKLDLPLIRIYALATFFKAFSLTPRGKHLVSVCLGTACHVRRAPAVLDELKRRLGVKPGETTEDMQYTLNTVNCVGACALGPIVVVDGEYHGQMSPGKVKKIVKKKKSDTGK